VPAEFVERLLPARFHGSVYSLILNHAEIVCVKWGGNERTINREVWVYMVRSRVKLPPEFGLQPWIDIAEDQILDTVN
jgi:hypothetical protein